jgi:glycosyltransferase involved in cell wall biosynthesis
MIAPSRSPTDPESVYLSVVVPAYDEVDRIGASVRRVLAFLDSRPYSSELIVVLDGGRPGADRAIAGVIRERGSSHRVVVLDNGQNRGKGFSVRRGVAASSGRYVLFVDADLSLPIEDAERFLDALRAGADVAIGSRALPESTESGAPQGARQSLSRLFNWAVRHLVVSGLRDTQCGFKAFDGERARALFRRQRIDGFAFDVEVLRIAERSGYRVAEVAVACEYHPSSSVRKIRHGASMLLDLMRIRWHDARGRYDACG